MAMGFKQDGPFDEAFIVPCTTTTVNKTIGGIAVNTIPAECTLHFEFSSIAADDPAELIERFRAEAMRIEESMREQNRDVRVEFTALAQIPGLDTPEDAGVVALAAELGGTPQPGQGHLWHRSRHVLQYRHPTVVCGPGDIAQAHATDDFIELEQIAACDTFIENLLAKRGS